MLVLTRKVGEVIVIGDSIRIKVVGVRDGQARIGVDAPGDLRIYRAEVYDRIAHENSAAADWSVGDMKKALSGVGVVSKGPAR